MPEKIELTEIIDPEINIDDYHSKDLIPPEEKMEEDVIDNIISASKNMVEFDKAFSLILNVVMKRTYAGDWVSHSRVTDPIHLRAASLSGAGCDRVATILGISEKNWKEHPKQVSEDGKYYTFRYEADFTWGGLTRHAYGECSTRNKFFGYENGAWKEISDVREDHVRKAAQRECQKDGIRRLLGLRKIPILKLKELGFNIDLVHFVNFKNPKDAVDNKTQPQQSNQKTDVTPEAETNNSKLEQVVIQIIGITAKTSSGGKAFSRIEDSEGVIYYSWGPDDSEKNTKLSKALYDKKTIVCMIKMDKYPTIESIVN